MRNLFALMLLVAALFVTGCGEKKSTPAPDKTTPPVETPAPPAEGATK